MFIEVEKQYIVPDNLFESWLRQYGDGKFDPDITTHDGMQLMVIPLTFNPNLTIISDDFHRRILQEQGIYNIVREPLSLLALAITSEGMIYAYLIMSLSRYNFGRKEFTDPQTTIDWQARRNLAIQGFRQQLGIE